MNGSRVRVALLGALVLLALAGSLTHPRLATGAEANRIVSGALSFFDLTVVTWLFTKRETALYGYLLNGILTLYGTVMMGHFSISRYLASGEKTSVLFLNPGFEGILTLWADFLVGYALYRLWMGMPGEGPLQAAADAARKAA